MATAGERVQEPRPRAAFPAQGRSHEPARPDTPKAMSTANRKPEPRFSRNRTKSDLAPPHRRLLGPARTAPLMIDTDLASRLLYRDALMLVIDKPAGIAVHKGPKGGVNLEAGFHTLRFGLPRNPALAHRLDRDTSGCLVLGRHRKALEQLGLLFKQGRIEKRYLAIVQGGPAEATGMIDLPLGRLDQSRGWWMKVDPAGLPAQTAWTVLARSECHALLELEPLTGRTHQLRVHCAARGFPILGDPIYGHGGAMGLQLHARRIVIPLYKEKPPIPVEAPLPKHMRAMLATYGLGVNEPTPCGSPIDPPPD
jgi:tRNA pseudouridine32 synthase/23S rRNA pseudouridine746 synthase